MVINSNRHNFLRLLLADHILVKSLFDLMRCRNILQIQNRLLFFLFLLRFLRLLHRILETAQIDHAYIGHVQQIRIIEFPFIKLLIHGIKTLLHTVCTDMYVIRKLDHRACLALRSAAEETEFLSFIFLLFCICILFYYFIIIIINFAHNDSFLSQYLPPI